MFLTFKRVAAAALFAAALCGGFVHAESEAKGADVAPFGKVLFRIYGDLGSADAAKRAQSIENNIKEIKKDPSYNASKFSVKQQDGIYDIVYDRRVIMGITAEQAKRTGKSEDALAQDYIKVISDAVAKERSFSGKMTLFLHIFLALIILALALLAFKYLFALDTYLRTLVLKQKNKADQSLKKEFDLGRQTRRIFFALNIVKIFLMAAVVFAAGLSFLALFPNTYDIALKIGSIVWEPVKTVLLAVWNYLPSLVMIIIIIVLFRISSKVLSFISDKVENGSVKIKGFKPDWAKTTYHLIIVLLFVFALILIFPFLPNSHSDVFKGISVFLGVLISLGSTSLINNVMSGLVITYMSPFRIGDRIKMGDNLGNVIEKTALVTRMRTPKNEIITIPNSMILSANTVNYSASARHYGLILHSFVTIGYSVPWRQVHELLKAAALKTPDVLKEPAPFILQNMLDDFYVQYEINVYTDKADEMLNIYSNLNMNIQDTFYEAGIEIASPHVFALRNAGKECMPAQYLPGGALKYGFDVALGAAPKQAGAEGPSAGSGKSGGADGETAGK